MGESKGCVVRGVGSTSLVAGRGSLGKIDYAEKLPAANWPARKRPWPGGPRVFSARLSLRAGKKFEGPRPTQDARRTPGLVLLTHAHTPAMTPPVAPPTATVLAERKVRLRCLRRLHSTSNPPAASH
jgi:hypothetical protein